MLKRLLGSLTICLLGIVMLGAVDGGARFGKLGHEMMCVCGCGQILLECNHVGCPDSSRMIDELREQVNLEASSSGPGADTRILNWFVAKYGATVLAAPIRGGFDIVAWILPLSVFGLSIIGTAVLVRVWTRKRHTLQPAAVAAGTPGDDALRARIRRETEY